MSLALAVVLGGLGGASVYWMAERSRANDVSPAADLPIIAVSTAAESDPAASPQPASEKSASAELQPSAAPSTAKAVASPEPADEEQPSAADEAEEAEEAEPKSRAAESDDEKSDQAAQTSKEDDDAPSARRSFKAKAESGEKPSSEESDKSSGEGGEKAMLSAARSKLRTGDTFGAQALLEQMRQRYPGGDYEQQRELLYIKTQKALGAIPAAKRSARAFAQAYPNSPYLGSLESLLLDP